MADRFERFLDLANFFEAGGISHLLVQRELSLFYHLPVMDKHFSLFSTFLMCLF